MRLVCTLGSSSEFGKAPLERQQLSGEKVEDGSCEEVQRDPHVEGMLLLRCNSITGVIFGGDTGDMPLSHPLYTV